MCARGLPYFNPHSIWKTLVQLAYDRKLDAEPFKAWSQNLGHENCLTTFSSYGEIPPSRQAEIIRGLATLGEAPDDLEGPTSCVSSPTKRNLLLSSLSDQNNLLRQVG